MKKTTHKTEMRIRRRGFSLMEVLLSTGILAGSSIALYELANLGRQHAISAQQQAQAQTLCESKLNELLSGAMPIETISEEPFFYDPEWTYSVELEPIESTSNFELSRMPSLVVLKVTVRKDAEGRNPVRKFSLSRWIRDPEQMESSESDEALEEGSFGNSSNKLRGRSK